MGVPRVEGRPRGMMSVGPRDVLLIGNRCAMGRRIALQIVLLSAQLHDEGQRLRGFGRVFFQEIQIKGWEPGGRRRVEGEGWQLNPCLLAAH